MTEWRSWHDRLSTNGRLARRADSRPRSAAAPCAGAESYFTMIDISRLSYPPTGQRTCGGGSQAGRKPRSFVCSTRVHQLHQRTGDVVHRAVGREFLHQRPVGLELVRQAARLGFPFAKVAPLPSACGPRIGRARALPGYGRRCVVDDDPARSCWRTQSNVRRISAY